MDDIIYEIIIHSKSLSYQSIELFNENETNAKNIADKLRFFLTKECPNTIDTVELYKIEDDYSGDCKFIRGKTIKLEF